MFKMYHGDETKRKSNPKKRANFLSLITFSFTFDLLRKGYKKDITEDDIYEVLPEFKSSRGGDKLEKQWHIEVTTKSKPSIYRLLWNCYGLYYLLLGLIQLSMKVIMIIALPRAQGKLISYFTPNSKLSKKDAIYYAVLVIVLNLIQTTYNHNYRFLITELGIKIKTAFCSLIYRKSLKLTSKSLSENGVGKIVTLISKDVNSLENAIIFWNDIWISAIVLVVASVILYSKVGVASLAGILLLILVIPLQVYLGKLTSVLRIKAAQATDKRIQLSQEILSHIKFIKMYTWEDFFIGKLLQTRNEEMTKMKYFYFARSAFTEVGSFFITFTFYILVTTYIRVGNTLTAEVGGLLRECLRALRSPITISIPLGILRSAELVASVRRIHQVLIAQEQNDISRKKAENSRPSIQLENVSVKLQECVILQSFNLKIDPGLHLVTGKVGSGKTSLLKTILEEYPLHQGDLKIEGTISYAPENPWLFPSSIKQNILFGQEFNKKRYKKVIRVCALEGDVNSFKRGDETIVDDNGRNLSRGQQVRIGLARAVYCDSDIYLLDNCLSSLDVHLKRYVFGECIKKFLSNKLVVMTSTSKELYENVDNIIVMENNTVKSCYKPSKTSVEEVEQIVEEEDFINGNVPDDLEEVEENSKLIENKTCKNIYHEESKQGKVQLSTYTKYFNSTGSIITFIWIILLYVARQTGIGYAEKSFSEWITTQQKLFDHNPNGTYSTQYKELLEEDLKKSNLYTLATIFSIFFLCLGVFFYFSFVAKVSIALHKSMVLSVLYATMHFFDLRYFGNILNRFSKDMYNTDELLPFNVDECLKFLFNLISIVILILSVSFDFSIPIFVLLVIIFFIRRFYISTGRSLQRLDAAIRSPVIGHVNATLEGLPSIRTYGMQEKLKQEFDKHQDLYISTYYMEQSASRVFAFSLDLLCNLFFAALVVRLLVTEKETRPGNVWLVLFPALSLSGRFQWGIREWANMENHMTSVERVLEYINAKKETKNGNSLDSMRSYGKITYENVNLSYDNTKKQVLKNINFTINPGEKIGIVGRTGTGKSSLMSILFRLYQYEGRILINDVDVSTVALDVIRSNIAIIPQDPFVFSDTIRKNIDPTGLYTDEHIWEGIKKVNLENLLCSLDNQILEKGSKFSSGQKQLICLVRTLISKNKIIILDEATANVNPDTDIIINRILKDDFAQCTVLTIAHKLRDVLNSDRVMVIVDGEIAEFDKPEVLMENENGFFYKMTIQKFD